MTIRSAAGLPTRRRFIDRLLPLMQIAWVIVALVSFALFIAAMPRYHQQALSLTNQDGFIHRDPGQWRAGLHHFGLSPQFYATFVVVFRSVIALALSATGIVIFLRKSRDWFGLYLSLALILFGCLQPPVNAEFPHSPLNAVAGQLWLFGLLGFFMLLYLFPDGRFVPRWTRWTAILFALFDVLPVSSRIDVPLQLGLSITLLVAPIYRYRHAADATQRQQMKWALFGMSLAVITAIVLGAVLQPVAPLLVRGDAARVLYDLATLSAITVALSLVPVFIGIAILRYRLWDIDVLINRTLVYGSLTVSLGSLYIAGVIGLQVLFRGLTGQSSGLAVAILTLVIAALFNPWRRRLQAFIDRRFYRRKYDAARTLAALQSKLRDEVDLDRLTAELLAVVQETMQPERVSMWLPAGPVNFKKEVDR